MSYGVLGWGFRGIGLAGVSIDSALVLGASATTSLTGRSSSQLECLVGCGGIAI